MLHVSFSAHFAASVRLWAEVPCFFADKCRPSAVRPCRPQARFQIQSTERTDRGNTLDTSYVFVMYWVRNSAGTPSVMTGVFGAPTHSLETNTELLSCLCHDRFLPNSLSSSVTRCCDSVTRHPTRETKRVRLIRDVSKDERNGPHDASGRHINLPSHLYFHYRSFSFPCLHDAHHSCFLVSPAYSQHTTS